MRNVLCLSLVAGCFAPSLDESMFTCSAEEPSCPSGFECRADTCVAEGSGATIEIVEPEQDQELNAEAPFTLAVDIQGLTINDNFPDDPVDGQGHWHWFVDDVYQAGVGTQSIDDAGPLDPGCHILKVDLRQNDHEAIDPPASDQIAVYSSDGGPTICIDVPPPGETVDPGQISVAVDVRNFTLDTEETDGHGHWHVWVDGSVVDAHIRTSETEVGIPNTSGEHTIMAELVANDAAHSPLNPPRTATVKVTVP